MTAIIRQLLDFARPRARRSRAARTCARWRARRAALLEPLAQKREVALEHRGADAGRSGRAWTRRRCSRR